MDLEGDLGLWNIEDERLLARKAGRK